MPETEPANEQELECLKYWIELAKWFIESVMLAVGISVIDPGFKDRAAGKVELNANDRYVTDLIVSNKPTTTASTIFRLLTVSEKLRRGWDTYYELLDAEHRAISHPPSLLPPIHAFLTDTGL